MEDFEGYDLNLLYEILYDGIMPKVYEIPKAKTFKYKFTKDPVFQPSEEPAKLEQLLTGRPTTKKAIKSSDPLDLIMSKELHDMSTSDKQIKNYLNDKRRYQASNLPVISMQDANELSKQVTVPTCVKICENYIIIGNFYGTISIFSHTFSELRTLSSPKNFGAVTSIDLSQDELYLISGYSGGQISLWDFKSGASIRVNNSYHTNEILNFSFWKSNNFTISADITGKVTLVEYTKNFLSTSISGIELIKGELGAIHDMQVLQSESTGLALDSCCVVSIVSTKGLYLYTLSPEVGCFYSNPRPASVSESVVASLAWKLVGQNINPSSSSCFYALAVVWGNYLVVYRVNFPIPEGVEVCSSFDLSSPAVSLAWLSGEALLVSDNLKDSVVLPLTGSKVISESVRGFELIARQGTGSEVLCKGLQVLGREAYLFGSKEAKMLKLLDWSQCIDWLTHKGEWLEVLSFGLDLYAKNYPSYYGAPETPEELQNILEQLITIYVKVGTIDWVHKISNTIEFCVGTGGVEIMFNMLLDYFVDHGGKESLECFVHTLEPYVCSGKIKKIPSFVLGKLIVFYIRNSNEQVIEKILLNVDPGSVDSDQVMPIIKEYKLFTAAIVICCNDGDFINPLKLMSESWLEEKEGFQKYYLLFKILWYLRLCFRGERFLHGKIYEAFYKENAEKLVKYLIDSQVLKSIIAKDSVTTFKVLYELFEFKLLDDYSDLFKTIFEAVKEKEELLLNFSLFTAKVCEKTEIPVNSEFIVPACIVLIKLNGPVESNAIGGSDIVSFIHNLSYQGGYLTAQANSATFNEMSLQDIGKVVLKMLQSVTLSDEEQKRLLECNKTIPHVLVKTYLLDLQKRYADSLNCFLNAEKAEDRAQVFEWLNSKFKEGPQNELQKKMIDRLGELVEIDSDKTSHLVKDWHKDGHSFIIKKLDSAPNLQLKYLAELPKDQYDKDLLLIYVRLLCLYDKAKLVKFLKNFDNDYIEESLSICKTFSASEAEALLNEKQGGVKEALEIWAVLISDTKTLLQRQVYKKEVISSKEIRSFGKLIRKYSKVCIRNVKALDLGEIEEFWFKIFRDCLDCFIEFKDYFYLYPQLEPMLHGCLNFILENMLEYVDLRAILDCLSSQYEDFPFKHIRQNIIKVLERFTHQQIIKQQALKLLKQDSACSINQLYSSRLEGHASDFFICRSCGKKVGQVAGNIFIFACGHVFHKRCQDLPYCFICNDSNKS